MFSAFSKIWSRCLPLASPKATFPLLEEYPPELPWEPGLTESTACYVYICITWCVFSLHGKGHGGLFLMCSYILLSVTPQEWKSTQVKRWLKGDCQYLGLKVPTFTYIHASSSISLCNRIINKKGSVFIILSQNLVWYRSQTCICCMFIITGVNF